MFLAFVAAATLAAGSATPASTPQAAPAAQAPKAKDPSSETVCWVEEPIGSHLPKRYCATRSSLDKRTDRDQADLSPFNHGAPGAGALRPSGNGVSSGH